MKFSLYSRNTSFKTLNRQCNYLTTSSEHFLHSNCTIPQFPTFSHGHRQPWEWQNAHTHTNSTLAGQWKCPRFSAHVSNYRSDRQLKSPPQQWGFHCTKARKSATLKCQGCWRPRNARTLNATTQPFRFFFSSILCIYFVIVLFCR